MSEQGEHLKQIDDIEKAHEVAKGMNFLMPIAMELQQYIRDIASDPEETQHYIHRKPDKKFGAEFFHEKIQFFERDQYGVKVISPLEDLIDRVDAVARDFDGSRNRARYSLGRYLEDYLDSIRDSESDDKSHSERKIYLGRHKGVPIPNEVIVDWGAEIVQELVVKANNYGDKLEKEYTEREVQEKQKREREEKEAKQAEEEYEQVCALENELKSWLAFNIGTLAIDQGSAVLCDYKEDLLAEKHNVEVLSAILAILGMESTVHDISDEKRVAIMKNLNSIYANGYGRAKSIYIDTWDRKIKFTWIFSDETDAK